MFDWITYLLTQSGYFGVAGLMFVENVFPPIPSELIMPLAGFKAAKGELDPYLTVLAGVTGSVAGALFWYYIGWLVSCERLEAWAARHGRILTMKPQDVDQAAAWFNRHGGKAVFFCRLVPTARTLISVPAGIAEMPLRAFLIYSTLGTLLWVGMLTASGYLLEQHYSHVSDYVAPVGKGVVAVVVIWYLWRVATFRRSVPKTTR